METATTLEKQLFIKMAVSAWETQNVRISKLLNELSDEHLLKPTAAGRNTGLYIIGHLTAISDAMISLLGWGQSQHANLYEMYVKNPENASLNNISVSEMKALWHSVNEKVTQHINGMTPEDWFTRHTAVSAEDFSKEPHRNKLNLLINRTNHHSYHLGQLVYLKTKQ